MKALSPWCALDGLARAAPRAHLSRRWLQVVCAGAQTWPRDRPWRPRDHFHQASLLSTYPRRSDTALESEAPSNLIPSEQVTPSTAPRAAVQQLSACPGCGALAQTIAPGEPGYYTLDRRVVSQFIKARNLEEQKKGKNDNEEQASDASEPQSAEVKPPAVQVPNCDRCHDLLHHSKGVPIVHPTMDSIQDTLAESKFRYNHVYHVIDAADFPMSLIKGIYRTLSVAPQRSKNRRAKHGGFRRGKNTEMSFIITRSDLLAPTKEQVDRLMPYMVDVLRDALGSRAEDVRLGNVRCVSAKRGWWTKNVKADIWVRGGAGWMVGKVNVGKSNLYETVFPKGSGKGIDIAKLRESARALQAPTELEDAEVTQNPTWAENPTESFEVPEDELEDNFMLPPARPEEPFPVMPTVSSLPGTTASPIRIPFGNGKGELIDMPGLARSNLENFVRPEFRQNLVMTSRVAPEQYTLKPGQSLLLGGLVRVTNVDERLTMLAYPFVPLKPHLTATQKAVAMESGERRSMIETIVEDETLSKMKSAGQFPLQWDVTKQRAGPLTAKSAVGLRPERLPFKVLSADILIESVGWVELVCQVRRADFPNEGGDVWSNGKSFNKIDFPKVEIFSPEGQFIASRRPMGAWLLSEKRPLSSVRKPARPRKSMAGAKKAEKQRLRAG